ncbi:hypothetical protein A2U01_0050878, partial [Trifolium medium]|nr:hypothetical protein [Trifolium medium]
DPPFEFDELVKTTRGGCNGFNYFITFKAAKQSSNTSSRIFQASTWTSFDGSSSMVRSCAIKRT